SFDLGHWDVTDMTHATAEAYEMVENGLISPEDFRTFAYGNSVQLYAGPNPDFFKGTIIEKQAAKELAAAKSR
ncbi:MAG TPA: amidohydrolase, partial [Alphaproteobacteria bacterium]|nr:amidohydrolase [Alphaproteobacteria bacterium]